MRRRRRCDFTQVTLRQCTRHVYSLRQDSRVTAQKITDIYEFFFKETIVNIELNSFGI